MKFDGILFCTDLDGTLFNSQRIVSKENKDAIEYFKAEGGRFTFITGRPPVISREVYEAVEPNAPIGCFNGGGIYDFTTEQLLWSVTLPKEADELVAVIDREVPEVGFQYNYSKGIYFCKENGAMERFREFTGAANVFMPYTEIAEPIIKVVFGDMNVENIEKTERLLRGHEKAATFDFIRSEETLFEILPKGVSKGALLLKLAEILNIEPSKTIAVGDYNNDISMVKAAGVGYAVENAVPELKAVADRITVSNNGHAIAKIVDELDRGIIKL